MQSTELIPTMWILFLCKKVSILIPQWYTAFKMQDRKTHWTCPTWASTFDWAWMFPIPLILPLAHSRLNPFSHPLSHFASIFIFTKFQTLVQGVRIAQRIPIYLFPRCLKHNILLYLLYLSLFLPLSPSPHIHAHTHAGTYILPISS